MSNEMNKGNDAVMKLIRNTFGMAEDLGTVDVRDAFDCFCAVWRDNKENLMKLSEFMEKRETYMYGFMSPRTKDMGILYGELNADLKKVLGK